MSNPLDKCLDCHRRFLRRHVRVAYCDDCTARRAARLKIALDKMRAEA